MCTSLEDLLIDVWNSGGASGTGWYCRCGAVTADTGGEAGKSVLSGASGFTGGADHAVMMVVVALVVLIMLLS